MFKVNKNISHNGRFYSAGSEIKPSEPGFKDLKAAGHVEGNESAAPMPAPEAPVEEQAQALIDDVEKLQEKPKLKKRK